MKKQILTALLLSVSALSYAQVGINTNDPKTMLDVNGSFATRETSLTVSGTSISINNTNSFYKLTGGSANFTMNFSAGTVNGQRIVIYNDTAFTATYGTFTVPTKTAQEFIFSGSAWYSVKAAPTNNFPTQLKWFYAPSLVLDTSLTAAARSVNVYENYKKQFTGSSTVETNTNYGPSGTVTSLPIYAVNELDYIVTGYDKSVFSNVSINSSGVLTYTVTGLATDKTFMNIVMVPKN